MEEMGSIFNRAATQANGVQNDVISQLADRGIPIYQALADQLGVTAGEVFKMASEGKIDFETFSAAAEKAAGTVAEEMGKTVPGAAKNFLAAMGRIGANALEGVYSKIGPLIAAATNALGPVEEKAKAFGGVLLRVVGPAMDWLTNLLNSIGDGTSGLAESFSGLSGVLAPVAAGLAALGSGGLAALLTRIPLLGGMLGGLTGPLAALGGPLGIAAAALAAFFATGGDADALASGISDIIGRITSALPGVIDAVTAAVPGIVDGILSAVPQLLAAATTIVGEFVLGLVTAVPMLVDGALALVDGLVAGLVANLPIIVLAAIKLVMTLIQGIVLALPMLVQGAVQLVTGLLTAIVNLLPVIIQGGIQLLLALVTGLIGALPMLLEAALQLITGLLGALIENLPMLIQAGIQLLLSLVTGLLGALPDLIVAAVQMVIQLVAGLITMLPQLIEAGVTLVIALITGLISAIPQILEMLPQIVDAIWNGLADIDWAQLGKDIVQGLIDGLGSMIGNLGDMIGDLASSAWDGFTSFFGIQSPSRLMRGAGVNLVEGAVGGVEDEERAFADSLVTMAKKASKRAQSAMGTVSTEVSTAVTSSRRLPGAGNGPPPPAGAGGVTVQQTFQMDHMDPEVVITSAGQQLASAARRVGV
jgi:tape measure domain-containing protein